jgi:hypothetical protein
MLSKFRIGRRSNDQCKHAEFFHRNKLPLEIGKRRPGLLFSGSRWVARFAGSLGLMRGKEFAAVSNNGYNRESDVASYLH